MTSKMTEAASTVASELTNLRSSEVIFTQDMMSQLIYFRTIDGSWSYSLSVHTLVALMADGVEALKEFARGLADKASKEKIPPYRESYRQEVVSELKKLLNRNTEIEDGGEELLIRFYNWRMIIPNKFIKDNEDCGHPAIQTATTLAEGIQHEFSYWIRSNASLPKYVGGRSFVKGE